MVLAMCVRVCLTDSLEGMNYKTYKDEKLRERLLSGSNYDHPDLCISNCDRI